MYILKTIYINNTECARGGHFLHFIDLTGLGSVNICLNVTAPVGRSKPCLSADQHKKSGRQTVDCNVTQALILINARPWRRKRKC